MSIADAISEAVDKTIEGIDQAKVEEPVVEDTAEETTEESTPEEGTSETDEVTVDEQDLETEVIDADAEEVDEGETEATELLELAPDQVVVLDGKEVSVSDALEIKATLTKKTQEFSEALKEREAEVSELQGVLEEVKDWMNEAQKNPTAVIVDFAKASNNPTEFLAQSIVEMNNQGLLDPEFAKVFGLEEPTGPIKGRAADKATSDRIRALEQRAELEEITRKAREDEDAMITAIEEEYETLLTRNNLSFDTEGEAEEFKRELFQVAVDNDIPSLAAAFKVLEAEKVTSRTAAQATKKAKAQASKKAAKRISRPSSAVTDTPPPATRTIEDGIALALDGLAG